jgi:hypothetical protein
MTTAAHAASVSTGAAPCGTSFDPYNYTETAVAGCGVTTFPLTAKQAISGGGLNYVYDVGDGATVEMAIPPPSFSPATATAAQLSEYDLPPRPTDLTQLSSWEHLSVVQPPPFLVATPYQAYGTLDSRHLSGYEATGAEGTFDGAAASWVEPQYYPTDACSTSDAVIWSGVGKEQIGVGDIFGQSGTAFGLAGMENHEAWFEQFTNYTDTGNTDIIPIPMVTLVGDQIASYQNYDPSYPGYKGWVWDIPTERLATWQFHDSPSVPSSHYYLGDGAEAMVERPRMGNPPHKTNLSNFHTVSFGTSYGNTTTGSTVYLDQWNGGLYNITTWSESSEPDPYIGPTGTGSADPGDNGEPMATASAIGTNGAFDVTQHHCS